MGVLGHHPFWLFCGLSCCALGVSGKPGFWRGVRVFTCCQGHVHQERGSVVCPCTREHLSVLTRSFSQQMLYAFCSLS